MPQMGVCLLRRTQCGEYHLLHYNCSVPYPASSQCSHAPCGVKIDDHGATYPIHSFLAAAVENLRSERISTRTFTASELESVPYPCS